MNIKSFLIIFFITFLSKGYSQTYWLATNDNSQSANYYCNQGTPAALTFVQKVIFVEANDGTILRNNDESGTLTTRPHKYVIDAGDCRYLEGPFALNNSNVWIPFTGNNTQTLSGLPAGTKTIKVQDANGCTERVEE